VTTASTPDPPLVSSDGEDAEAFLDLVAAERQAIGRDRFAGRDPAVRGPSGARAAVTLARILAADREGAPLNLGAGAQWPQVNPAEDRAEDALQRAIAALTQWGFAVARRELSVAAALARAAARQQRIELLRALVGLVRAVALTLPGDPLRGEEATARGVLARLDALPLAERDHYAAETARLVGHWRAAAADDDEWRAWALLRGRLALREGAVAEESALAWALRAWDRGIPREERSPDPTLDALLSSARVIFQPLVDGAAAPPELDDRGRPIAPPRATDVLAAIAAALAPRDGSQEPYAVTRRFALAAYHATTDPRADEGAA